MSTAPHPGSSALPCLLARKAVTPWLPKYQGATAILGRNGLPPRDVEVAVVIPASILPAAAGPSHPKKTNVIDRRNY